MPWHSDRLPRCHEFHGRIQPDYRRAIGQDLQQDKTHASPVEKQQGRCQTQRNQFDSACTQEMSSEKDCREDEKAYPEFHLNA